MAGETKTLRRLRLERALSQAQVAEKARLTVSTISHAERGFFMSPRTCRALAACYGRSTAYILDSFEAGKGGES